MALCERDGRVTWRCRARVDWAGAPPGLHPDLKELVHACLRPNPAERPTSAEVRQWAHSHADVVNGSSFD